MHKTGVILLAIGGVILLIGAIALVVGFSSAKDLLENLRPDTKSIWSGSSAGGPQKKTFDKAGEYAVWVEGTVKPTFSAKDAEENEAFQPLGAEFTLNINEKTFQQLGNVNVQAGKEYTLTIDGQGKVYITEPMSQEETQKAAGGLFGGLFGGCCGVATGGILLILGLILGLTLKKKEAAV